MKKYLYPLLIVLLIIFFSSFTSGAFAQDDRGFTWTQNMDLLSNPLRGIAYNGSNLYVAVGDDGTIKTSSDGINWTYQESGTTNGFFDVLWSGTQFVAVGNTIMLSSNGTQWLKANVPAISSPMSQLFSITWNGHRYVAVGGGFDNRTGKFYSLIVTSTDGTNWTEATSGVDEQIMSVACNDSLFVAVGDNGTILTSSDGFNWSQVNSGSSDMLLGVRWLNNRFIITGDNGTFFTSPDGETWTQASLGTNDYLEDIACNSTKYVIVGQTANGGTILTLTNRNNWYRVNTGVFLTKVIWDGKRFIAIGWAGAVLTSSDGLTWQYQTKNACESMNGVIWGGNQYISVGNGGTILASTDGTSWTPRTSGTEESLSDVVWNGNEFVAVGWNGPILTSTDGIQWIKRDYGDNEQLEMVVWNGNQFVAVGWAGVILTSPDGINWTKQISGVEGRNDNLNDLEGVTWDGNKFVAVGSLENTILVSHDGINWTQEPSGTDDALYDVVYNGSEFVAVGDYGTILSSSDGVHWTPRTSGTDSPLQRVTWNGKEFVAVGRQGTVLTSYDGVTWDMMTSDTGNWLNDVTWNGDTFVAVGENGTILTAAPGNIIKVEVNGRPLVFDVAPTIIQGRTMVPMRAVFEALGATVAWNADTRTVTGQKGDVTIVLTINSDDATINGIHKVLDVPATIIDGRTFVPIRFISESLGNEVTWNAATQTVVVTSH